MFVAVWPPPPVVADVGAAVAVLQGRVRAGASLWWTAPGQWHVTLRFLGEVDAAAAVRAFRSFRSVEPSGGPVVAELGPSTGRFGRRVLHVPVTGLEGLASAAAAATAGVGQPPDDRPFSGHLTLARARTRGGADLSGLAGQAVSGRWEVAELTLVASRRGRDGARYEIVEVARLPG